LSKSKVDKQQPTAADVNAALSKLSGTSEEQQTDEAGWKGIESDRDPKNHDAVAKTLLNVARYLEEAPPLKDGAIALNELTDEMEFSRDVDFGEGQQKFSKGQKIKENEILQLRIVLNKFVKEDFGTGMMYDAVRTIGFHNRYNPIKQYLESLRWDNTPRIDQWLQKYMGANDNVYTRAVGSKFLIQAVARGLEPGCPSDWMLVLEGKQEVGKNAAMLALCPVPEWTVTIQTTDIDKDMTVSLEGRWLAEFAEMLTVTKAETNALKAFITQRVDTYRKSHRRDHVDHKRSAVLWGGTNQRENYLPDETGNRRFNPVGVVGFIDVDGELKLDRDGIARDRDQLWAEALVRHQGGESHLLTGAAKVIAVREQDARTVTDAWEELVVEFVAKAGGFTTVSAILKTAVGLVDKEIGRREEIRVTKILTKLGWTPTRTNTQRRWLKPGK
jgi:predicted P-loop ATPase